MPTKRQRMTRGMVNYELPACVLRYIETGKLPEADDPEAIGVFKFGASDWAAIRDVFLSGWIDEHPGARPWAWWEWDAPPATRDRPHGFKDLRRKVAGSGRENANVYSFGVPWFCDVDPSDPPQIESEGAYLARHELFAPRERRRVKPAAFAPVEGTWEPWDELGYVDDTDDEPEPAA